VLRRLLDSTRAHRGRIRSATLFSILNKVFDLAPPLLIGMAVDIVVRREQSLLGDWGIEDPRHQVVWLAGATLLIWVLESVSQYVARVVWRNLAQAIQHELRLEAYAHVQKLEMAYFEDRSTGGLMAVLNDDVNQLERFLDTGADQIIQTLTTVVVIGAIFFVIDPAVAWIGVLPIPFILWGSFAFVKRIAPRYRAVRDQAGFLNGALANNLGGIATIKSFTAEEREVERIAVESGTYREANRHAIRLSSAFSPLIRMVILVGFTGMLVVGGFRTLDGAMAAGSYSVLVFLTQRLLWPLTRLGEVFDLFHRAMASTGRILDLLDTTPRITDGPGLSRQSAAGAEADDASLASVRFEGVTFAYDRGHPVLEGLSLDVPAGETTAIVGATGSGKTTVVKLLLRFYEPQRGRILLDGEDIAVLKLWELRRRIALVSQDVYLFHGSVRENIAYGAPGATDAEIIEAARLAEAHAFVERLPVGYDTIVGERGQKLSGGQRQRVSLARAILKDAPILVLDEATSSVDNETEAAIHRSLARVSRGRTTLVIAHRLSTVRHADRIHVLEHGRLKEHGTHEELVAAGGAYAGLWQVQTGESE